MGKLIAMLLGINSYIRAEIRVAVKELLLEEFTGSMTERDHWGGQQFLERTIDCKIERRTNEIIRDKVATATRFQREDGPFFEYAKVFHLILYHRLKLSDPNH